ncbi:glucan endo-1,3-beta-glucosidase 12-like isoform X1 [Musa acuminata AAA Group]|uniref:glucan endo-1,3-beta-glucosidase 12-like isoform X1 n=1 Tax=Musa acuminata AAA Group TaxID=214697 RepID=UPI0008A0A80A|nr:PREDICTED: glucan endo-1,3-beta-glucosidase 12-like isoform X1 [Musa acuminata subsp. malaccensis]
MAIKSSKLCTCICYHQFLQIVSAGVVAKGSEDGLSSGPSLARTTDSNKEMVYEPGKQFNRFLLAETELQSSKTMPEMDVVTPITTVPVLNPTITTPTTTTPDYNPFPTTSTTPTTDPYSTPAMVTPSSSSSSSQSWCVASQTASKTGLQVALDYACGYGGADCSAIQEGGSCYNPNTVRDHASYAFNEYYQKNPIPTSCDFGGTAVITNVDPSTSTCQHPSTSTSSSVLNTTIPTGSTVFGSVPPATSDSTLMLNGMTLVITVTCLVMSLFFSSVCKIDTKDIL